VRKTRQGTEHTEPCLDVGTSYPTSYLNICFRQKWSQQTNIQQYFVWLCCFIWPKSAYHMIGVHVYYLSQDPLHLLISSFLSYREIKTNKKW